MFPVGIRAALFGVVQGVSRVQAQTPKRVRRPHSSSFRAPSGKSCPQSVSMPVQLLSPPHPVPSIRSSGTGAHPVIFDFVALSVLLLITNYLFAPDDVGWFAANPTPFLVVPALLGIRHGLKVGLFTGLLTALFLLVVRNVLGDGTSFPAHGHLLLAYPLSGVLMGLGAGWLPGRGASSEQTPESLESENVRLRAARELLLLSSQDLRQRLAFCGAEATALDEELQDLVATSRQFTPENLLGALERITRVRGAALYRVSSGYCSQLKRVALLGNSTRLPEVVEAEDHPIVVEALSRKSFLIQKTLREATPSRSAGYLAAYPIEDADGSGSCVLIVDDLPLQECGPKTFDVMKSICDWVNFTLEAVPCPRLGPATLSQLSFFAAIEKAVKTHREQAIPSILVRIPFDYGEEAGLTESLQQVLAGLPNETVLSTAFEEGRSFLLFLLPPVQDPVTRDEIRETMDVFAEDLGLGLENAPHFVMTAPGLTAQQLWGKLVAVSQKDVPSSPSQ